MLRLGEAANEHQAKARVQEVIDRALAVEEALRSTGRTK
jgi:hypothetical protein